MSANSYVSGTGAAGAFGQATGNSVRLRLETLNEIAEIEPASTPVWTILNKIEGKTRSISSPEVTFQEEWPLNHIGVGTASETSSDTTIALADASFLVPGLLLKVKRTGEQIYVRTVPSTTSFTCYRGFGTTAAAACVAGDEYIVLGYAANEGQNAAQTRARATNSHTGYAEKFMEARAITDLMMANRGVYGPSEKARLNKQAIREFKKQMNRQFLLGEPYKKENVTDQSGSGVIYATAGIRYYAMLYNAISLPGAFTRLALAQAAFPIMRFGGAGDKFAVCGSSLKEQINNMLYGLGAIRATQSENAVGMDITTIKVQGGNLHVIVDYTMDSFADELILFDLNHIELCDYEPYSVEPNIQDNGSQRDQWQLKRRVALINRLPISSGVISGLQYAAG